MKANIKLTRFVSDDAALPDAKRQAWPVAILAEGINIDDHIFVYHVGRQDDPIPGDRFECVASVNQMYEIPKNQGVSLTTQTQIPYYRSNALEYVARSATEAQEIWLKVVDDAQWLVRNFNAALKLKATQFAEIDEEISVITDISMNPPIRIPLSYHPAGSSGVDGNGKPVIAAPDTLQVGWLPAYVLGPSIIKPPGAAFYYNINRDANLGSNWPPKQPYSGNQLHRNGILMPYDVVWTIDDFTVWWLNFDPATIPGYQRQSPQSNDWGAPWPADYVSRGSPGAVPNLLTLTLFK
jgi:hypothetical protein